MLSLRFGFLPALGLLGCVLLIQEPVQTIILPGFHHLGDDVTPEWPEASPEPEGAGRLEVSFPARKNAHSWTLRLSQRHVSNRWSIQINGREIGVLPKGDATQILYHPIPAGFLRYGNNTLALVTNSLADDVVLGNGVLFDQPIRRVLHLGEIQLKVVDFQTGELLPARLTLVDGAGVLAPLREAQRLHTAVRPGTLYTSDGLAQAWIPEGTYEVWASKGMEWSAARAQVHIVEGRSTRCTLALTHEVSTPNYVAADTHIHTLTHSGHGDSTVEERMVTLAAEGVELAIATDHNHNTDYLPTQKAMGLQAWFTPVVGNEVSTPIGHYNAFPLDPADSVPPHKPFQVENPLDYSQLILGIRDAGARVVILNHPRWPDFNRGPFGVLQLDRNNGGRLRNTPFDFDAIEVFNSTTKVVSPDEILLDWYSLLNRGETITAVGSSDSHTVSDRVGEGRTYVWSSATDPGNIDIQEACNSFVDGITSCSLGLFAEILDGERPAMGALLAPVEGRAKLTLRVAGASWVTPPTVGIRINGEIAAEFQIPKQDGPLDVRIPLDLNLPAQDAWLTCMIRAPLPESAFWQSMMPYLAALTNPVRFDVDGDGKWTAPLFP